MLQLVLLAGLALGGRIDSDSSDVAAVVRDFHAALERGDSTHALQLLHPDVVVIEAGAVETFDQYRSHHLPADIEFARAVKGEQSEVHVQVSGKMAWAWSTSTSKGTFHDRPVDSVGAEMITFLKTDRGWRITGVHWSSRRRAAS